MVIDEILQREAFTTAICRSLELGWSTQFGIPFSVVAPESGSSGQVWKLQRMLSVFHTGPPSRHSRKFSADLVRHTTARRRREAQWILGSVRSTRLGFCLLGTPSFVVEPKVPNGPRLLVLPGNRRHRTIDFDSGLTRVMLKAGFCNSAIEKEVAVRSQRGGPFVPILSHGSGWFEEPIFPGRPLNRWSDLRLRVQWRERAWEQLASWLSRTEKEVKVSGYVGGLLERIERGTSQLAEVFQVVRFQDFRVIAAQLAATASSLDAVTLAASHGDFQEGNVLVDPVGRRLSLSDWEYSEYRAREFDFLVYALRLRHPPGVARRVDAFAISGELPHGMVLPYADVAGSERRRAHLALVLLEEIVRLIEDALSGPFVRPPAAVLTMLSELAPEPGRGRALDWLG